MDAIYMNLKQSQLEFHGGSVENVTCSVCVDLKHSTYVSWVDLEHSAKAEDACQSCSLIYRGLMSFEAEVKRLKSPDAVIDIEVSSRSYKDKDLCKDEVQPTLRVTTQFIFDTEAESSDPPVYEFFVRAGQTSPYPTIRPCLDFNDSLLSARWLDTATVWIRECVSTHSRCRDLGVTELPRRLLNIGPKVYLADTENTKGVYVCLSYCWGKNAIPSLRTTRANHESIQKDGIKWGAIPPTMKHAIMIARLLHVNFLWIDSLCIIQDDEEDWERESGNVASIYQNAFLTISAVSSMGASQGIFCKAEQRCKQVVTVPLSTKDVNSVAICVRRSLKHTQFHSMYQMSYDDAPLLGRAWAFQEHLLSTRTLQFTSSELLWECNQSQKCECGGVVEGGEQIKQTHSICLEENSITSLSTLWSLVVQKYTSLDLTMQKDRLPALSGIAKQILQLGTLGTYHAGLWEKDFAHGLLWFHPHGLTRSRPSQYRAPSWSWASVEGISHLSLHLLEDSPPFKVFDIHTEVSGADPTGACEFGMCVLGGLSVRSVLTCFWEDKEDSPHQSIQTRLKYKLQCGLKDSWTFNPDFEIVDNTSPSASINFRSDVRLLLVGREPAMGVQLCFLVLACADQKETIYQRIGLTKIAETTASNHVAREDLQASSFAVI